MINFNIRGAFAYGINIVSFKKFINKLKSNKSLELEKKFYIACMPDKILPIEFFGSVYQEKSKSNSFLFHEYYNSLVDSIKEKTGYEYVIYRHTLDRQFIIFCPLSLIIYFTKTGMKTTILLKV